MSPSGRIWLADTRAVRGLPATSSSKPGLASAIRAWSRSRSLRSPHVRQTTSARLPCSSVTSALPAAWCRPSTFWVMTGPEDAPPLQVGDGVVGGVGLGVREALPADERAGPVPAAGLAGADELAVLHRRDPAGAVGAPVVGDPAVGRHPGAREHEGAGVRAEQRGERDGIRHTGDSRTGELSRPPVATRTGSVEHGRMPGREFACCSSARTGADVVTFLTQVEPGRVGRSGTTRPGHTGAGRVLGATTTWHRKEHDRAQTDQGGRGGCRCALPCNHRHPTMPARGHTPWANPVTTRCRRHQRQRGRWLLPPDLRAGPTPERRGRDTPVYIYVPEGALDLGGLEGVDSLDPSLRPEPERRVHPVRRQLARRLPHHPGPDRRPRRRAGRPDRPDRRGRTSATSALAVGTEGTRQRRAGHARLQRPGRVVLRLLGRHRTPPGTSLPSTSTRRG